MLVGILTSKPSELTSEIDVTVFFLSTASMAPLSEVGVTMLGRGRSFSGEWTLYLVSVSRALLVPGCYCSQSQELTRSWVLLLT
jgi:hypothetical protein